MPVDTVKNMNKIEMNIFGKFKDKALENAFMNDEMKKNAGFLGPIIMVLGFIFITFLISDFMDIQDERSLTIITMIRVFVFILSVTIAMGIWRYKGDHYRHFTHLVTTYEVVCIIGFLLIINQYDTISSMCLFSVLLIVLAVYVLPNKLINVQIINALFLIIFTLLFKNRMEGLDTSHYQYLAVYCFIFFILGSINAYITNYYIRKQYIDGKELQRLSITDYLTGIYNRAKFIDVLQCCIQKNSVQQKMHSVILCDIDDFKKVNDTFGHFAGDRVLQNIVSIIKNCIRPNDIFARWGGEEFTILLPDSDLQQSYELAQQIRMSIQNDNHCIMEEDAHYITCSFGLVSLKTEDNLETLMHRADLLLYKAKSAGKNVVICEE